MQSIPLKLGEGKSTSKCNFMLFYSPSIIYKVNEDINLYVGDLSCEIFFFIF